MPRSTRKTPFWIYALVGGMVFAIVVAHVFLWRSDMPTEQKLMWTVLNTIAWTIILGPVFLVDRWLSSIEARNADRKTD